MPDTLQSFISGEPREADVAALSAELDALWRAAAEDSGGHHAVTRACAMTMLVYTESEEAGLEVSNLLGALTLQNPCRALIMVVRPDDAPAGLSARISAVCQLPAPGEKQVCCEHITVVARGDAVRDLDKVVLPLTVSGLPVYLWWRAGCPTQPEYFTKVLRYVDRVFVDSERFPNPQADLAALAGHHQDPSEPFITDLNWARITPWRELMAQCFDSEDTRPYLSKINEIRIEYRQERADRKSSLGQALLYLAWLASRLGWEPLRQASDVAAGSAAEGQNRSSHFRFSGPDGTIKVELAPSAGGAACASGFLSVELKVAGDQPATFSLVCGGDDQCVFTRIEVPSRRPIERTVHLHVFDEVGLLNEELKFPGRDRIYAESLSMIASTTS